MKCTGPDLKVAVICCQDLTKNAPGHNNVLQYLIIMELECFKYKEKMNADKAYCKHPGDYCKYRTSCMIQFLSGENKPKQEKMDNSDQNQSEKRVEYSTFKNTTR